MTDHALKYSKEWREVKESGSEHYKTGEGNVEPIDLMRSGGILRDFAVGSIIKYAFRNRGALGCPVNPVDMEKTKHFAEILMSLSMEETE